MPDERPTDQTMSPAEVAEELRDYEAFLGEPRNAICCIARTDEAGRPLGPHATPVWFDYTGGRFRLSITRTRVKYRLLEAHPSVSLVIDASPGFRTVIAEGAATVSDDPAELVSLRRALWRKYGGRGDIETISDEELLRGLQEEQRVVVTVTPRRVLCWSGD